MATSSAEPDYRGLLESVGDAIYVLDLEGRFTFVNGAFLRIAGYAGDAAAEVIGRHFVELLTPESSRVALEHFRAGIAGDSDGTPFFEVDVLRSDGSTVQVEIRAGDLVEDGVRVGRQGVARDITELKRLHALVAEKSERLALLEQRTRIAHELYQRIGQLTFEAPAVEAAPSRAALEEMRRSLKLVAAADAGLSATDLRVVELVGSGNSNREIAAEVNLSPDTVKDRVGKAMALLGCRSRAELAAEAARRGLI
jgi:PAS domain S-box-containing protein